MFERGLEIDPKNIDLKAALGGPPLARYFSALLRAALLGALGGARQQGIAGRSE